MSRWVKEENLFKSRNPWSDMSLLSDRKREVAVAPLPEAAMSASSIFVVGYVVMSISPSELHTRRELRSAWNFEGARDVTGMVIASS